MFLLEVGVSSGMLDLCYQFEGFYSEGRGLTPNSDSATILSTPEDVTVIASDFKANRKTVKVWRVLEDMEGKRLLAPY